MKRYVIGALAAVLLSSPAFAYDEMLAKTYEQFFSSFEEKQVPKALHLIPPEKVVEAVKRGDEIVLLDVRTKQEQSIVGLTFLSAEAADE